jgi:hypothetical protein
MNQSEAENANEVDNSILALIESTESGVVMELVGYGPTSFDPAHVKAHNDDDSIVGGVTTFYLTAQDVEHLRHLLVE